MKLFFYFYLETVQRLKTSIIRKYLVISGLPSYTISGAVVILC